MRIFLTSLVALFALVKPVQAQQASWKHVLEKPVLKLKLSPLSGDGVKAFFIGRGFAGKHTQYLADEACVFRSDIGSRAAKGGAKLEIGVDEWRVITRSGKTAPRLRDQWAAYWKQQGVDEEQRTAFYWAMFPTRQVFQPSDYNWGMFSFMLPAGAKFDLQLVWYVNNQKHQHIIRGMECGK